MDKLILHDGTQYTVTSIRRAESLIGGITNGQTVLVVVDNIE